MLKTVISWLRQPTTIGGLAAVVYVITGLATHNMTFDAAWPVLSAAAVGLGIKDNSSTILHQSQTNGANLTGSTPPTT